MATTTSLETLVFIYKGEEKEYAPFKNNNNNNNNNKEYAAFQT